MTGNRLVRATPDDDDVQYEAGLPDAGFEQALRDALRSMMKGHDR